MDLWSVGAIFSELISCRPLLRGDSEIDQIFRIFRTFGTPNEDSWPGVSKLRDYDWRIPKWNGAQLGQVFAHMPCPESLDLCVVYTYLNKYFYLSINNAKLCIVLENDET